MQGPILSDGLDFDPKPMCSFDTWTCESLVFADHQYAYCKAQADSAPILRLGFGTRLFSQEPNHACPYKNLCETNTVLYLSNKRTNNGGM